MSLEEAAKALSAALDEGRNETSLEDFRDHPTFSYVRLLQAWPARPLPMKPPGRRA